MNPIIFYSIMAAVVFIAVYSLFITKEKPKKETPDLQSNTMHDSLNYVLARDSKEKIMEDKIADLSGKLNAALAEISVCNNLIKNKERMIELKQMRIELLIQRISEIVKVGSVVTGYVLPHGKNQSTGKVLKITRRGNYLLDNGKTVKLN